MSAAGTFFEAQAGLTPHFPGEMTCLEEEQGQSDDLNSKDGKSPEEGQNDEKAPTVENNIKAAQADEIKSFKCKEKELRLQSQVVDLFATSIRLVSPCLFGLSPSVPTYKAFALTVAGAKGRRSQHRGERARL